MPRYFEISIVHSKKFTLGKHTSCEVNENHQFYENLQLSLPVYQL
jgi:hypothetical protein